MRDDRNRWDPVEDHSTPVTIGGVTLQEVHLPRQMMVSGVNVRDTFGPAIGWPDIVQSDSCTLSLRRDRVLIVGGDAMAEGWDSTNGHAVSDMTSGFRVFDLTGDTALAVLQRGAEVTFQVPSPSVSRLLFGLNCALYCIGNTMHFRLHVARGHAEALVGNLRSAMTAAAQ